MNETGGRRGSQGALDHAYFNLSKTCDQKSLLVTSLSPQAVHLYAAEAQQQQHPPALERKPRPLQRAHTTRLLLTQGFSEEAHG